MSQPSPSSAARAVIAFLTPSREHRDEVQRVIDRLDAAVDSGCKPTDLAAVRTALVALRDEPKSLYADQQESR